MLQTRRIDEDFCCLLLPQLKKYTGTVDESQDSILMSCLRTAIIEVQDRRGRSVVPCEMRLDISDNCDSEIHLYGKVTEIKSVMTPDGVEVPFKHFGNLVHTGLAVFENLVIDYATGVDEGERMRLLPVVFQYASALFDGQVDELHKILEQC